MCVKCWDWPRFSFCRTIRALGRAGRKLGMNPAIFTAQISQCPPIHADTSQGQPAPEQGLAGWVAACPLAFYSLVLWCYFFVADQKGPSRVPKTCWCQDLISADLGDPTPPPWPLKWFVLMPFPTIPSPDIHRGLGGSLHSSGCPEALGLGREICTPWVSGPLGHSRVAGGGS